MSMDTKKKKKIYSCLIVWVCVYVEGILERAMPRIAAENTQRRVLCEFTEWKQ